MNGLVLSCEKLLMVILISILALTHYKNRKILEEYDTNVYHHSWNVNLNFENIEDKFQFHLKFEL